MVFIDCITWAETRYAGYFDVAAGREAPRWVGWTGLDAAATIADRFSGQKTKRTTFGKKCQRYFHAVLIINKTY